MPKTRRLTGVAALSAASLASIAVAGPVAANPPVCEECQSPGDYSFHKVESNFFKLETPGLGRAYFKLGIIHDGKAILK